MIGVALLVPREALATGWGQGTQQVWSAAAILIGALSWAVGVRYAATAPLPADPFVRAATTLLERCSATLVSTHTYVNRVIAVFLGWLFAGEAVTTRVLGATALILAAVLLLKSGTSPSPRELVALRRSRLAG